MRFREVIPGMNREESERRFLEYIEHLADLGFSANDPVYRVFLGEVFHDGELVVDRIELSSMTVSLKFQNTWALWKVQEYLDAKPSKGPAVLEEDFLTRVTFHQVSLFSVTAPMPGCPHATYKVAELGKSGEKITLEMLFDVYDMEKDGLLTIVSGSVVVEDIRSRIRKYIGQGDDVERYVTRIDRDPEYYLAHPDVLRWRPED